MRGALPYSPIFAGLALFWLGLLPVCGLEAIREWDAHEPIPLRQVFSGHTLVLTYDLIPPFAGTLTAEADVHALSTRLAAPLERRSPLEIEPPPSDRRRNQVRFRFQAPEVEKIADIIVMPRVRMGEETQWIPLAPRKVRIYPGNLLDGLRDHAERNPLFVAPGADRLKVWLTGHDIPFRQVQATSSGRFSEKGLILLETVEGRLPHPSPTPESQQVLIVFFDTYGGLPRAILRPEGAGAIMEIKLPLIDQLEENPLAQEAFIEIIKTARTSLANLET